MTAKKTFTLDSVVVFKRIPVQSKIQRIETKKFAFDIRLN